MTKLLRRHRAVRRSADESGFTLIELLMVLVVLPLLLGGLAAMLIVLLQNSAPGDPHGVATRLSDSQDAQLTAAYFNRDVQDASYVTTSTSPLCSGGTAGGQLVGLQWTSGSQTIDVTYYVQSSPPELMRYYCVSASTPSYPVSATTSSVIADNVFSKLTSVSVGSWAPYLAATVNCFGGACPASLNSLPGMPANSSTGVGVDDVVIQAQESNSSYHYSLTASPRNSNPFISYSTTNQNPFPPLIVSGSGGISGGNCSITDAGGAAVNSAANGSISDQPTGTITASGGIFTSDTSVSSATSGSKGTVSPSPVYGSPVTSPYAGLTAASSYTGGSYPVVTESASNWDPSTDTSVETGGVLSSASYPNGAIFVVTNGIKMSKAFSAPQGVLFYVTGGNVALNGNGTLDLNPLNPNFESPTQPQPELVIWMASSDTGTLTLGGNGNATLINGAIYSPAATTALNGGGNSGGLTVDALDTGNITCVGQDSVAVVGGSGGAPASTITVTPSVATVAANVPLSANFVIQGSSSTTPTGTVTVYSCGPAASTLGCGQTTGWTPSAADQVGSAVTSFTATGVGGASGTSGTFTPTTAGTYCFAASYVGGNYASSSDTTGDGCFTVTANPPPVVTVAVPVSNQCYGTGSGCTAWPGSISGTASDVGGPGLSKVLVSVYENGTPNEYYNPGDGKFDSSTPTSISVTVSGTASTPWSTPFSPTWDNGKNTYTVTAESVDSSGTTGTPVSVSFSHK